MGANIYLRGSLLPIHWQRFSPFLRDFPTKKGLQLPNEIKFDKIISFVMVGCHFQPQKSKNIKIFGYPKIFQTFQNTMSRLLFMRGSSATAQMEDFRISF